MTEQQEKTMRKVLALLEHFNKGKSSPVVRGEFDEEIEELRQALAQEEKREWVGLTDEEIAKADCVAMDYVGAGDYGLVEETIVDFAKAIEAKLKEKNT